MVILVPAQNETDTTYVMKQNTKKRDRYFVKTETAAGYKT
jgi:hypothetical protein